VKIERTADEVPLHVELEGSGPTLVLLHAFGGSARNFRPQSRALRARQRVVLFDVRGHARSAAPRDRAAYRPERFAADVGRVLDHVGAARAVVGGLSMGAGIALRFALAAPQRVRGLALAAVPPGAREQSQAIWAHAFADAIEREGLEAAGARFVWSDRSGFGPQAKRLIRMGFLEHPPHALAHTLRELIATQPSAADLAAQLGADTPPALVIVGGSDEISRRPSAALARALPGSRLVVVEGAGHVVNLAAPRPFNRALAQFLATLAPE
jgi:pimeloyl-ACP methyl ester carboxylesterase